MLRPGHIIALCVIALLGLGVVMINSAGMEIVPRRAKPAPNAAAATTPAGPATSTPANAPATAQVVSSGSPAQTTPQAPSTAFAPTPITLATIATSQPAKFMVIALAAMAFASWLPIRRIADRCFPEGRSAGWAGIVPLLLTVGTLLSVMALVYVQGVGKQVRGSERWLRLQLPGLGELSLQPSEFAKWAMLAALAWYCVRRAAVMPRFWAGLAPGLAAVVVVAGFIAKEDLGTGTLIATVSCLLLVAGGARLWQFAMFVPLGVAGFWALVKAEPYRMARIAAFLHPYDDPRDTGYHTIQSIGAVAGGEGWGRGLGMGVQKFGYLPEDTNDFLFAIICEELGVAGAALTITLFLVLLWTLLGVIRREHNPVLKLFSLGVTATIGLQAFINIAVVTAMVPTKGIPLPLVSAGGTGWTLTAFSLGLVVAIARTQTARLDSPLDPRPNSSARPARIAAA